MMSILGMRAPAAARMTFLGEYSIYLANAYAGRYYAYDGV